MKSYLQPNSSDAAYKKHWVQCFNEEDEIENKYIKLIYEGDERVLPSGEFILIGIKLTEPKKFVNVTNDNIFELSPRRHIPVGCSTAPSTTSSDTGRSNSPEIKTRIDPSFFELDSIGGDKAKETQIEISISNNCIRTGEGDAKCVVAFGEKEEMQIKRNKMEKKQRDRIKRQKTVKNNDELLTVL